MSTLRSLILVTLSIFVFSFFLNWSGLSPVTRNLCLISA